MLHLIPAPAHRLVLRLAHGARRSWWQVGKPRLAGCRVLAFDMEGRLLLVRHSYGTGKWMPPGGGLKRDEDVLTAAKRELLEETGCILDWASEIERAEEMLHGATNAVNIIAGVTRSLPIADGREIIEAAFFATDALPEPMPAMFRERLPQWIESWIREATAARHQDAEVVPFLPPAQRG